MSCWSYIISTWMVFWYKGLNACFIREMNKVSLYAVDGDTWHGSAQSHACLMHFCINGFCFSTSIAARDIYHGINITYMQAHHYHHHRHRHHHHTCGCISKWCDGKLHLFIAYPHPFSPITRINTLEWIKAKDNSIALLIYALIIMWLFCRTL